MKFLCGIFFCSIAVCLLLYSCSDNGSNNPVAPCEASCTLTGYIHNVMLSKGMSDVTVHIVGGNTDSTVFTDENGVFVIDDLQEGDYIVKSSADGFMFGPSEKHITAHDGINKADFMGILFRENNTVLAGRIVTDERLPVNNVTLHCENVAISDWLERIKNSHSCQTNAKGYYLVWGRLDSGATYKITLEKPGYDYVFFPDSCYVTIGEDFMVANFEAHNIGEPLSSISGKVIPLDGSDFTVSVLLYQQDVFSPIIAELDRKGEYGFYGLKSGSYRLEFLFPRYGDIILEKDKTEVMLQDKDIVIPDNMAFNRITDYRVSGRLVDENGSGFDNTLITVSTNESAAWFKKVYTDPNGDFSLKLTFEVDEERTYSFVPEREGLSFSPDTLFVRLNWIKYVPKSEKILPDFIGYDHTKTTDAGFFPISTGKSWKYKRTENGENSTELTVSIIGTVNYNNGTYYRFSERIPWKFTDFRSDENDVYTYFDDNEMLFLRFGIAPGTEWECGLEAGVYPRVGIYLGAETVDTPAGVLENCAHFEMKVTYSDDMYDSYDLWYASGVGLVKSINIAVENGEVFNQITDELKSYD